MACQKHAILYQKTLDDLLQETILQDLTTCYSITVFSSLVEREV